MITFNDYRDLEVWRRGVEIVKQVYLLTQTYPPSELYGITSQIRRAAISIPANIAEGWGRRYPAEFIQFLRQANGSRTELETHLIICSEIGLAKEEAIQPILDALTVLGRQILNLERSLRQKRS